MMRPTSPVITAGGSLAIALLLSTIARAQHAPADCDCRAKGTTWRQGQEVCLGGTLRVCGMDQNVSAWIETKKPCPEAGLAPAVRRVAVADAATCLPAPGSQRLQGGRTG